MPQHLFKTFVSALCLFAPATVHAQGWPDESAIDSLTFAAIAGNDTSITKDGAWNQQLHIRDSVTRKIVGAFVDAEAREGRYRWPYSLWHVSADTVPRLTATRKYRLKEMGIDPEGISAGCVGRDWFGTYDELMLQAIEGRFGSGVLTRIAVAADSLDRAGAGLSLPFIIHPDSTVSILQRHFAFLGPVPARGVASPSPGERYLFLEFKNGNLVSVRPGIMNFYVEPDHSIYDRIPELTAIAKRLRWTGPHYAGKGATATVLFGIQHGEMWFQF